VPARCNWSDDKMSPSVTDFIATEARLGAQNYKPLGVVLSRARRLCVGHARQPLSSIACRLFGGEPGSLPIRKFMAAMVEQAGRLTLTSRAFHNDQLALVLRGGRGA